MGLGLPEIIVIIVAAGVLLFGGKKIVELSRGMGRASGEFKKAKQEVERELRSETDATAAQQQSATPSQQQTATPTGAAPVQDDQSSTNGTETDAPKQQ